MNTDPPNARPGERAEPVRKAPARSRRPRKPKVVEGGS